MATASPPVSRPAHTPFVPASVSLPEITVKAFVLGIVLAVVLAGANAYLGLFAGMTVSASIPAAVISMGVLRLFPTSNILENNIVQTCASAGESLAAGIIFTLPALVLLGRWARFDFLQTALIGGFGGVLGVLFTVPLRRALIVEQPLQFPEGIACAEVLETGERGGSNVKFVAWAAIVAAIFKFTQTGLRLFADTAEGARYLFGRRTIVYMGTNLSPALVAVGYIVGLNIATLVFLGGAVNWLVAIPMLVWARGGAPAGVSAIDYANHLWSTQTRYLGVGAMIVGGLWALIRMRGSVFSGIQSGMAAYREMKKGIVRDRLDRDMPMQWVLVAIVVSIVPLFFLYHFLVGAIGMSLAMAVIMVVAGFLFCAVSGYMTGLVGSSNNPVSGVTIATLLFASGVLLLLFGRDRAAGPTAAILIGAVVACAAAIAGDNLHDLKTGYLVGSTPWKQQVMLIVGTLVSALVMAPVLNLLLDAYGIGPVTAAHPQSLTAPQATLMASVAAGVFKGGLPWLMVNLGMGVAVLIIAADLWLERRGAEFRMPVLAVAIGIYLPFNLSVPIFLGGLVAFLVHRTLKRRAARGGAAEAEAWKEVEQRGILISSGLITGEALVGILMAIPIVLSGRSDVLALWGVQNLVLPGLLILLALLYGIYKASTPATVRTS
ncbi:MAG TPA: oligopeptide transporter, OPT family [Vicinamibacterales bacterium]|nr:oligopeptide transporter, OPT family [Vicinamibacterales bacterium]